MKFLITGATAGIGKATAEHCLKKGHSVILTGRREDRLKEFAKAHAKASLITAVFDIRRRIEVEKFLRDFSSEIQQVDVLVNNAGLARGSEKMQSAKVEDWEEMMETNVMGLLYLTRGLLPHLLQKKSHIVNMGSAAGRWVYPGGGVYCASKFAVRALSEGLRMDLLGHNVRVTNIEPGMVETEFSAVRFRDPEKAQKFYQGMNPLTADDIAECILWSVERPAHVNIQEMVIFPTDQGAIGQVHRPQAPDSQTNR